MISQKPPGAEARAGRFPGPSLIPDLHAIQREHGWLPREELVKLSRDRRRPLYEIEGLISFYPHFRTAPPPEREIACCHDLACWLHGSDERIAALHAEHDSDASVELREVSCIGRCDRAPAVSTEAELRRTDVQRPNDPYGPDARDYRVLRGSPDAAELIQALKDSELRGMGGAGFPTGTKWELVAKQEAEPKYAICNADESEPGTFKDRQILAEQPHLVLEGLVLGMVATGCREGWVFVRHEYELEEEVLREELERMRGLGLLDEAGVTVDIFTSPGGYILGEESALIECMEGHRGEPRNKPPFPGVAGPVGEADADELCRDVRPRAGDRRAGRGVVEVAGRERRDGAEVLRGVRAYREAGRVLRPDGHDDARAARPGRRRERGTRAAGLPAGRRLVELPRPRATRRAARLRAAGRGGLDAGLGRGGGDRGGHRPAGRRDERAALLPERVVREVRAVPGGLDQGAHDPVRVDRVRRRPRRR